MRFAFVTEHARGLSSEQFERFINECAHLSDESILLIPGLEFDFAERHDTHILMAGLRTIPEGTAVNQVLHSARQQGALIAVAHPSRNSHYIPKDIVNTIDGIEFWNAAYNSRYLPDEKAIMLLGRLRKRNKHLVGIGGLDLHSVEGFRGLRIRLENGFKDSSDLISLIKHGRFTVHGTFLSLRSDATIGLITFCFIRILRTFLNIVDKIRTYLVHLIRQLRTIPARRVVL